MADRGITRDVAGTAAPESPAAARGASPELEPAGGVPVVILADDLIWAIRLEGFVRDAGMHAVRVRNLDGLERALREQGGAGAVIVDLTSRAYDGVTAIARTAPFRPVLAVAQHDDLALRRRALDAGASSVVAYAKMHANGRAVVAGWLGPLRRPGRTGRPA